MTRSLPPWQSMRQHSLVTFIVNSWDKMTFARWVRLTSTIPIKVSRQRKVKGNDVGIYLSRLFLLFKIYFGYPMSTARSWLFNRLAEVIRSQKSLIHFLLNSRLVCHQTELKWSLWNNLSIDLNVFATLSQGSTSHATPRKNKWIWHHCRLVFRGRTNRRDLDEHDNEQDLFIPSIPSCLKSTAPGIIVVVVNDQN